MSNSEVIVRVTLDQFRTIDLLNELINRIDDDLNDPEPKYDPYLNSLSKETKKQMLKCLREYY